MARSPGRAALVLHSHMPYVEGFGTWPFGEEWLFEAIATSYLPLVELLDGGAPLTVSLTPVLCDQLEAPGLDARLQTFLREIRAETHRRDIAATDDPALAAELERSAADYAHAAAALAALDGDLLGALGRHAGWTSSATHAVLPLLATDAGIRLQLQTGIDAHRERFGDWAGGFWLPECAHSDHLHGLLEDAGVHATCVDLSDVFGIGAREHLTPLATDAGPLLVPLDRAMIDLVWSEDGYPSAAAYRDYHHRTAHDHNPWAVDGSVYDRGRAAAQVRADARDFVARWVARVADGGLSVVAVDTELLGHWWYEGVTWLAAVVEEAEAQGLALTPLDAALADVEPAAPRTLPTTTWGRPRDLSTWDAPRVAEIAFAARRAELDVVAAGRAVTPRAARELLALQSSDWAFLVSGQETGDYPARRAAGHLEALRRELAGERGEPQLRNLAPRLDVAPLLEP